MATDEYARHVKDQMTLIDKAISRAAARLSNPGVGAKARALEELESLRLRRARLAERLEAAEREGAGNWSELKLSIRQEADGLLDAVESWLTRMT